jgi:hypothetical protein
MYLLNVDQYLDLDLDVGFVDFDIHFDGDVDVGHGTFQT